MVDVSVVIATYRRPHELREAVRSALAQQGVTVEVFVVDDCPDGSARSTIEGIADPRVMYSRTPAPTGGRPALVRNLAWPQARGTAVHFLDDDDLVPDGFYAAALAAFSESAAGVVFGRVDPFGADADEVARERVYWADAARRAARCRRFGTKRAFAACLLFECAPLVCSAAIIRRECIGALGGFDPALPINEDVEFYARAIRRFGAVFVDRVALFRRIGPSLIHQPNLDPAFATTYGHMHADYRRRWGTAEFVALKTFARAALR